MHRRLNTLRHNSFSAMLLSLTSDDLADYGTPASRPDPKLVVQEFLDALNAGDADKALALLVQLPEDTSLLTNQVLELMRTNDSLPFTDITLVGDGNDRAPVIGDNAIVTASYDVGGVEAREQLYLLKWDGSSWRIEFGVAGIAVIDQVAAFDVTVNGAAAPSGPILLTLFPGVYTIDSANPMIGLKGGPVTVVVTSPTSNPTITLGALDITDAGLAAARLAARDKLKSMLEAQVTADQSWCFVSDASIDDILPEMIPMTTRAQWRATPPDEIRILVSSNTEGDVSHHISITVVDLDMSSADPDTMKSSLIIY